MATYSFQDSVTVRTPLSGVCGWCEAARPGGRGRGAKLKKCGGCSVVLYCSTKCQTEAWPTHKHMCRSRSKEEAARLGYTSAVSVARTLHTWVAMHAWSLRTIAEAFAHTDGGVDHHLKNQRAIVFVLFPRKPDGASDSDNPAGAFVLGHAGIADKDERDFLRVQWPVLEATGKNMAEAMRAKLTAAERRAFAGFIPAAFHFKETGIVAFYHYPLYRLRAHGCGPSFEHSLTREEDMLLDDVGQLCGALINRGFVLHARRNDNQALPEAGLCVEYKKSWAWVPSDPWKWETLGVDAQSQYKSGLSPAEIYKEYHKLLARRNFQ
ncbi:hypothetical protein LXA43DRAFT_1102891 [Ganoderma leucocontextum]|nr:hypothetical protein LXA43DRAFT_1102891 [Ganoderma leucocontextum]